MDFEKLSELWADQILPADKWLLDPPVWFHTKPIEMTLGPYDVECPPDTLPDGMGLILRGRHVVPSDGLQVMLLVTGTGSTGTQLRRLCKHPGFHDIPGWHGLVDPSGFDPGHIDDRSLIGIIKEHAVRRFCEETNISAPKQASPRTLFN